MAKGTNSYTSNNSDPRLVQLSLLALGVVFGDIGTSPLYAFRLCFSGEFGIAPSHENVLGVLSLIFWSLIVVISIKYIAFVLRADNHGEGGVLALLTLVSSQREIGRRWRRILMIIGIFGSALFYGDAMLTPSVSVLSAVEGLQIVTPIFDPYVVPFTVVILVLLFMFQHRGTGVVGIIFGPVMLLWFLTLAMLGARWIINTPKVLESLNPLYAISFFLNNGFSGFFLLGAVFLVVTGGEALYADIGHFGKRPIRLMWLLIVLPSLLLNYFGQGAFLIKNSEIGLNTFYMLSPTWGVVPLVVLSTGATIIASQAVISGAFSLTRQALQLGYVPRMDLRHTSHHEIGQVYVPFVNWVLLVGTVLLVVEFQSSNNLAAAYGLAVVTLMAVTTILIFVCSTTLWGWSILKASTIMMFLLFVDLAFLGANIIKFTHGAWIPIVVASAVYILMVTWKKGRSILRERLKADQVSVATLLSDLVRFPPIRVPGTAVFMASNPTGVPRTMLHNLKHNKVLHESVIILTVANEEIPRVPRSRRVEIKELAPDFHRIIAHYGFMEKPSVPDVFRQAKEKGLEFDMMETTFFLGRETLVLSPLKMIRRWQKVLFAVMSRNAQSATDHYGIPPNRAVELGVQVEI